MAEDETVRALTREVRREREARERAERERDEEKRLLAQSLEHRAEHMDRLTARAEKAEAEVERLKSQIHAISQEP